MFWRGGRGPDRILNYSKLESSLFGGISYLDRQHVYPHLFRHACATHVLESSGSIRDVQELLGHAAISTTAIYTHLDAQHLLKVYSGTHPRARRVKDSP